MKYLVELLLAVAKGICKLKKEQPYAFKKCVVGFEIAFNLTYVAFLSLLPLILFYGYWVNQINKPALLLVPISMSMGIIYLLHLIGKQIKKHSYMFQG